MKTLVIDSRAPGLTERILEAVAVHTLVPGKIQRDTDLQLLASHPNAEALRSLSLGGEFTDKGLNALASSDRLGQLEALLIHGSLATKEGLMQLVHSEKLGSLKKLHIRHSFDLYKAIKDKNPRKELQIEPM